jgi:hypothetical protein
MILNLCLGCFLYSVFCFLWFLTLNPPTSSKFCVLPTFLQCSSMVHPSKRYSVWIILLIYKFVFQLAMPCVVTYLYSTYVH